MDVVVDVVVDSSVDVVVDTTVSTMVDTTDVVVDATLINWIYYHYHCC